MSATESLLKELESLLAAAVSMAQVHQFDQIRLSTSKAEDLLAKLRLLKATGGIR